MLRVNITIVPFGVEHNARQILEMTFGLKATSPCFHTRQNLGCYDVTVQPLPLGTGSTVTFEITNHQRDMPNGAAELVRRGLEAYCDPALR